MLSLALGVVYKNNGVVGKVVSVVALSFEDEEEDNSQYRPQYQQQQQQYSHFQQQQQQQQPQQQQQQPPLNPLLRQASTSAIGLLFGLLIWRTISAYELISQISHELVKFFAVAPMVFILCANLAGFVVNVFRPLGFKNHLKFILVLNILRECIALCYNAIMVVVASSGGGSVPDVPREVFFGRFLSNCWWMFLCLTFSKSRWVSNPQQQQPSPQQQQPPYRPHPYPRQQ